jgi:phosphoacetylglucosamine mutase
MNSSRFNKAQLICKEAGEVPLGLSYGTAGFRSRHERLDGICARMGCLAALRSLQLRNLAIGVVITASHNPIEDNGLKLVDADGGMLSRKWEDYACWLATCKSDEVAQVLAKIFEESELTHEKERASFYRFRRGIGADAHNPKTATLVIARDTRPSSLRLQTLLARGAAAVFEDAGFVEDAGVLTTPQLHHIVRMRNMPPIVPLSLLQRALNSSVIEADASNFTGEDGYFKMLTLAYKGVLDGETVNSSMRGPLVLDCANGVGGIQAQALSDAFSPDCLSFELRNVGKTEAELARLNDGVGAEHCQKDRKPPASFTAESDGGKRCASLDGDADRLVYHFFDKKTLEWRLLDGDKIACLAATFVGGLLRDSGFDLTSSASTSDKHGSSHEEITKEEEEQIGAQSLFSQPISLGVVQTAYANGASRAYIVDKKGLGLPEVGLAKTGVKYVHHAAAGYDIGIYFEANGHGTILFNPSFQKRLVQSMQAGDGDGDSLKARALRRLFWTTLLVNQAIGDALSDALLVEVALSILGWSIQDWDALYSDLPSVQLKVVVPDRSLVKVSADETRVLSPVELQTLIDAVAANENKGRAFVRPSGTEDVVRVYAEASDLEGAIRLSQGVVASVKKILL